VASPRDTKKKETQTEALLNLAKDVRVWRSPDETVFVTIRRSGHSEHLPIREKAFRRYLVRKYYLHKGGAPGSQAVQDALGAIEARGYYEGEEHPCHLRLAGFEDKIYLDLCNSKWEIVEIDGAGWSLVPSENCPVRFHRKRGMLPLPEPKAGVRIDHLNVLTNLCGDGWVLVASWLAGALRDTGPYPILCLEGPQGSGKSTVARMLRNLVDPSIAPIRSAPRDERDLVIAANNGWVIALDNLTGLSPWLSDALCRISTGGGFTTRKLYTDSEETIFSAMRPILANGIDSIATRHDLLDRSLVVTLNAIPEERRKPESEIWNKFDTLKPGILGALLNAVSEGIRTVDRVKLDGLPRMADFAKWAVACEGAMPWDAGAFMAAYKANRSEAVKDSLNANPATDALQQFMAERTEWTGTASELLEQLSELTEDSTKRLKTWPQQPNSLTQRLKRASTFLAAVGLQVLFERSGERRIIKIEWMGDLSSQPSQPSREVVNPHGSRGSVNDDNNAGNGGERDVNRHPDKLVESLEECHSCDDNDENDDKIHIQSNKTTEHDYPNEVNL